MYCFELHIGIQYNLSTPAEHGTDMNGRISQDPEYRRSYHLPQNTHISVINYYIAYFLCRECVIRFCMRLICTVNSKTINKIQTIYFLPLKLVYSDMYVYNITGQL